MASAGMVCVSWSMKAVAVGEGLMQLMPATWADMRRRKYCWLTRKKSGRSRDWTDSC